jgi:1-acyl-sn-glycerol-3-phosphate acyltransferase
MRRYWAWYQFFRYGITKTGLYFFYSKIEIEGKEKIPRDKPVLLLPNHQNSFMDALLVATHYPGYMFFLTRAQAFKTPFMNWFLRSLNMLPVYRVRDGLSSVTKNNQIFDLCVEYLNKKYPILVFPEANHDLKRRIRPLSKGFTRIAFDAEAKSDWKLDLQIVPIGVNYSEHRRSRNRVRVVFGDPIPMAQYQEVFEQDARKAANVLKKDVSDAMKKTVMHVTNLDHYPVHQIVLAGMEQDQQQIIDPVTANNRVALVEEHITEPIVEAGKTAFEFSEKYQISVRSLVGRKKPSLLLFLMSPLYLFSWLNNILPYQPARNIVENKIKDHAFDASIKFLLGVMLFPAFWGLVALILLLAGVNGTWISVYLLLSLVTVVLFKNANLFSFELLERKRLTKIRSEHPKEYAKFEEAVKTLNEFRSRVL